MGNCLRLGISRIGLAWSKWRMSAKFKKKNVSIIILGMQAVGKSTIALRLYKFKRTLPDTNYVQTKGFNTYTVKKKKTTVNIYDLGGHPSIQELWDHYYADAHGVIFVVDTSQRDTVPEAGRLLAKVLSDDRIRGKPVLLLGNKIDLDGTAENELDTMLNLQQLVNSVRCLTRLDVSCATDLKNDNGIFEGFKWLVSHIESNYMDINNRVLSDTLEEKNREKARREALKAARLQEKLAAENDSNASPVPIASGRRTPSGRTPTLSLRSRFSLSGSATSRKSKNELNHATLTAETGNISPSPSQQSQKVNTSSSGLSLSPATVKASSAASSGPSRPNTVKNGSEPEDGGAKKKNNGKQPPAAKIPPALLPPICSTLNTPLFVDQPMKLPRLKSPKSKQEVINRIEDHCEGMQNLVPDGNGSGANCSNNSISNGNQQYFDDKGFRFRQISAARRLSPEGADSDDGIINYAYEPTEDLSSDSTPIGVRRHHFDGGDDSELPNKELFMVTTLAEVHKEYFKDRKGSTSTHDSVSMSMASMISEATTDNMDDGQASLSKMGAGPQQIDDKLGDNLAKKPALKGKSKKRFNMKNRNKTAPSEAQSDHSNIPSTPGTPTIDPTKLSNFVRDQLNQELPPPNLPPHLRQVNGSSKPSSRTASASSKASGSGKKMPFTVSNAWERGPGENLEMNRFNGVSVNHQENGGGSNNQNPQRF